MTETHINNLQEPALGHWVEGAMKIFNSSVPSDRRIPSDRPVKWCTKTPSEWLRS